MRIGSPRHSKKRLLTAALITAMGAVGAAYTLLEKPSVVMPISVTPPEAAQRFTNSKAEALYAPTPMPKAAPASRSGAVAARRRSGPAVYKCEEPSGAVTYSELPCGDGTMVDTRPTSGGFSDNWSISVKQR